MKMYVIKHEENKFILGVGATKCEEGTIKVFAYHNEEAEYSALYTNVTTASTALGYYNKTFPDTNFYIEEVEI